MASKTAILSVKVVSDVQKAKQGLEEVEGAAGKMGKGLDKATIPAAAALASLVALGKGAIDAASELQQSTGAVESVFKEQSAAILEASKTAADGVGLASSEYQNLSTVLGAQLKNTGTPMDEVAGKTQNLISLGSDLAATFGGETSDAVAAISSLLRGERDPIERYGVAIKAADVEARLAAQGLAGLEGEARKQAEAQATLALLMEQTADAQGAFARETDTAATAQQIAAARYENSKAALGEKLLPVYTAFQNVLAAGAQFVANHSTAVLVAGGIIATFAAGILAANLALKAYHGYQVAVKVATTVWTAAQTALNFVMNANPLGLVITAIAALAAGIYYAYNNSETFRNGVHWLWEKIKTGASWAVGAIQPVVDIFWTVVDAVKSAYNWVADLFSSFTPPAWLSSLGSLVGLSVAPADGMELVGVNMAATTPALYRASAPILRSPRPALAAAPSINVTVNGALDPVAVAAQIKDILTRHERRYGGVTL